MRSSTLTLSIPGIASNTHTPVYLSFLGYAGVYFSIEITVYVGGTR